MAFDLENPFPSSEHTLTSLFLTESDHMPPRTYPQTLDFDISLRRQTISLISQLSRNFDSLLSYLAINYLDRFLSTQPIPEVKPWILSLVSVACVTLALKMRKAECSVTDIQQENGFIFDSRTIERMELLILGALKWRMRSITPFSFMGFFISLFKFKDPPLKQALKARAIEIILKAQNEFKLFEFKPSIISASALLSASHELFPLQFQSFRNAISNCSYVNKDNLFTCYNAMQEIVIDGYESVLSSSNSPVNVLDRQSSSSACQMTNATAEAIEIATINNRVDKDVKRRKINGFRSDTKFQLSQVNQHQHC